MSENGNGNGKVTPLLEQYFEIKRQHPDTILLFQVGDFFELFFDDAKHIAPILSITLTKRGKHLGEDIPICGVPVSSLSYHLGKLIKHGLRVAICEQVSKPIPGEVVQRKVTRVLTPGTLTDLPMLDAKKQSFLCAFWPIGEEWGVVFAELLGAKLFATKIANKQLHTLDSELARFFPDEILLPHTSDVKDFQQYLAKRGYCINFTDPLNGNNGNSNHQTNLLEDKYSFQKNSSLQNYLAKRLPKDIFAPLFSHTCLEHSFALLASYLYAYHADFLPSVEEVSFYQPEDFLILDNVTLKNLEIVRNNQNQTSEHTLFAAIDRCKTGMGSRALRQALLFPIKNKQLLSYRADFVEGLFSSFINFSQLGELCGKLCDLERIVGRIALGRANWQDYVLLKKGLITAKEIAKLVQKLPTTEIGNAALEGLPDLPEISSLLEKGLEEDLLADRKIKTGFSQELDAARNFTLGTEQEILKLEQAEIQRTKIGNLKIKYTDILGYFYEINSNKLANVPADYRLLQSLVGRSRFTSESLRELAYQISNAEQNCKRIEDELFAGICLAVQATLLPLRRTAHTLGQLDMFYSLAKIAYDNNYCRPKFTDTDELLITQGRHPVVELCAGINFIPNDTHFSENERLMILTGPNMGGKSTYLRQVALIVILAHIGSFVPAKSCQLAIIDRIFTRIGSGDNLAAGKSTFLVEMEEVALICQSATKKSLIILDEVGRGTSTFDGMAIAQAILEYLFTSVSPKTLFATHYHELTTLAGTHPGIKNNHMGCREIGENLVFSHRLLPGAAGASFGIAVAKLAKIPAPILARAQIILQQLKNGKHSPTESFAQTTFLQQPMATITPAVAVKNLHTELAEEILQEIKNLVLDELSPRAAYQLLEDLQNRAAEKIKD